VHNLQLISFCVFLFLAWLCVNKLRFFRNSGMNNTLLLSLFSLKLLTGFFLGWFALEYVPFANDYSKLHDQGIAEKEILINQPGEFISELFRSNYSNGRGGWFDSVGSYWNDLRNNLIVKLLAVLNIFSGNNYYSNSIFFNFFAFAGHMALYRLFIKLYGTANQRAIIIVVFLIPATLFFSSGIHKDSIIFSSLTMFFYLFHSITQEKANKGKLLTLFLLLAAITLFRNYVLIALIPAIAGYLLSKRLNIPTSWVFIGIYLFLFTLIFCLERLSPQHSPLAVIAKKRTDFQQLGKANTELPPFTFQPKLQSVISHFPEAFDHGFLRPYPGEGRHPLHKTAGVELALLWLAVLAGCWRLKGRPLQSFEWMMICFCITGLLFIGYIVPNYGSIIRYRSLYLPILTIPFIIRAFGRKHIKY